MAARLMMVIASPPIRVHPYNSTSSQIASAPRHTRKFLSNVTSVSTSWKVLGCGRPCKTVKIYAKAMSGDATAPQTAVKETGRVDVPRVKFHDGSATQFAPLVNGCWSLAGGHGRVVESEIVEVMELYAQSGLTTFDTADIYGPSERILGAFRERWEGSKRNLGESGTDHAPQSMAALRTPKLDLVQLHWWDYEVPGMVDVAKSLTDLREKGLIASIGTTNMSTEALAQIVDAGVPIVCNQVQFSLFDRRPQNAMLKYCGERDIKLLTYGTLAGGLISNRYLTEGQTGFTYPTPDLNTSSLKMYWRIVQEAGGQDYWRRLLSTLGEIATSKKVSIAAVALRWAMQQGPVHPIVGLRNAIHLKDNLTVFKFSLESAEIGKIEEVLATSSGGPRGDCYEMERAS